MFITNEGKAYWIKVHEIPESNRTSRGAHIKALLTVSPNEEITTVVSLKDFSDTQFLFMATAAGVVKKVRTSEFRNAKTRGIIAIKLDEGDKLVSAILSSGNDELVLVSRKGQALRIAEDSVNVLGRAAHGVRGLKLSAEDELAGALHVEAHSAMLILTEYGYGKRVQFEEFMPHGRGTGGQRIYSISQKTGEVVGAITVAETDEVVCITSQGKTLRVQANTISMQGRTAQGVRILNIESPDMVIGIDRVANEEDPRKNEVSVSENSSGSDQEVNNTEISELDE
jgi:DNA gyrase subunit A